MNNLEREDIAVIDTNVVTILSERKDSIERDFFEAELVGKQLVISYITVYEVWWGVENKGMGDPRREEIMSDVSGYEVAHTSAETIAAIVWLRVQCNQQQLSWPDLLIASTALSLKCPLATDDRDLAKTLRDIGIEGVISPCSRD